HGNENEPFGLAVLEALAAGTPVIGPRQGGVGELIDETVGQRAERATASGLADAITALFARDVEALSAQARLRAEQRHGWAAPFSGLARIYGGLVQGTVSRPLALSA
ncbi:MAG TPA: glycosyltransferase, partial [Phenylobacterium sp.]|nr:glycosyltransferase [Phenylobacterium sp.]